MPIRKLALLAIASALFISCSYKDKAIDEAIDPNPNESVEVINGNRIDPDDEEEVDIEERGVAEPFTEEELIPPREPDFERY